MYFLLLILYVSIVAGFCNQGTRSLESQIETNNTKVVETIQNDANARISKWMCPCLNGGSCYSPGLNNPEH